MPRQVKVNGKRRVFLIYLLPLQDAFSAIQGVAFLTRNESASGEERLRFSRRTLSRLAELFERGSGGDTEGFGQWLELAGLFMTADSSVIVRNTEFFKGFAEHVREVLEKCPDTWFEGSDALLLKAGWFARDLEKTSRASLLDSASAIKTTINVRRKAGRRFENDAEAIAAELLYSVHSGDAANIDLKREELFRNLEAAPSHEPLLTLHISEAWQALLLAIVEERREMFDSVLTHILLLAGKFGVSPELEERFVKLFRMLSRFSVSKRTGEQMKSIAEWLESAAAKLSVFVSTFAFSRLLEARKDDFANVLESLWSDLANYAVARRRELFCSQLSLLLEMAYSIGAAQGSLFPLPIIVHTLPRSGGNWEKLFIRILDGFYNRENWSEADRRSLERTYRNIYFRATDSSSLRMLAMSEVLERLSHRIGTEEAVREMVSHIRLALGIPYNEYEKLLRHLKKKSPAVLEPSSERVEDLVWSEVILARAAELDFVGLERSPETRAVLEAFGADTTKTAALVEKATARLRPTSRQLSRSLEDMLTRAALEAERKSMLEFSLRSMDLSVYDHYLMSREEDGPIRALPTEGAAIGIFASSGAYDRPLVTLFFAGDERVAREEFRGRLMQAFFSFEPDGKPLVHVYNRNLEKLVPAISFVTRRCLDTFRDSLISSGGVFDIALVDFRSLETVSLISCEAMLDFTGRQIEAQTLMASAEFDGALAILEEMLSSEQVPTGTHYLIGLCLKKRLKKGDAERALEHFKEEFRLNPHSYEAASSIGIYYKQADRFEEAVEWMEISQSMKANYVSNMLSLASAYLSMEITVERLDRVVRLGVASYNIIPEDRAVKDFLSQVRRLFDIDIALYAKLAPVDTSIVA
jgi:tetratricopeptide (TPR) repeat protein